jgi:hypothetical protein
VTALAAKALELARAAIGVTEHPHGSNRGPEVDDYQRDVGIEPDIVGGKSWCAAFVSSRIKHAALALAAPRKFHGSASCRRLVELNELLEIPTPEPGCVFVHLNADGTGHCGFVESLAAGGALETIEGNSDAHGSRTGGSVVSGFRRAGYATHFLTIC